MTGARLLTVALQEAGVDTIFALSGNQIMPVFDACLDERIRIIHTRHEAAAVFMADAYAQLTGNVGVALVTAGPGFLNALGALYMARMSESPVLLLSGDSPVAQDERGAFQTLDQSACAAPVVKRTYRVGTAHDVAASVHEAMAIALGGRPGPVHLAMPFDVLTASTDGIVSTPDAGAVENPLPDAARVSELGRLIAAASRPVILLGPRLNPTRAPGLAEAITLAASAPVVCLESPRGLNDPGLGGFADALSEADLIVSLGKRIDFGVGFGRAPVVASDAAAAIVDAEPESFGLARRAFGERVRFALEAEPGAVARMLCAAGIAQPERVGWRARVTGALKAEPVRPRQSGAGLSPVVVFAAVQRLIERVPQPILVVDGGEIGQWAQVCLSAPARIINGASGGIGSALCHALGAKAAQPNATVVAVMGDGAAGFHLSELETASRLGLTVIAVIGDDARWNAEYQIQLRDYGPDRIHATTLGNVGYESVAEGLGCFGARVRQADELEAALEAASRCGRPACIAASIDGWPAPTFR